MLVSYCKDRVCPTLRIVLHINVKHIYLVYMQWQIIFDSGSVPTYIRDRSSLLGYLCIYLLTLYCIFFFIKVTIHKIEINI